MNQIIRYFKFLIVCLFISLGFRFLNILYQNHEQSNLVKKTCDLVGLSLQTGALRTAYESMTFAIKSTTSKNFCISISESDRSFSPPCIDPQKNYEITHCKAIGNDAVLASVSFETENFFNKTFFIILLMFTISLYLIIYIINTLTKYLMTEFSAVTLNLFKHESHQDKEQPQNSFISIYINKILSTFGISSQLDEFKSETRIKLSEYENKFKKEAIEKERFKNLTFSNELYIQKVKQIRHDIRSPLSSIQAAYEAIDKSNPASTAVASAIRRIQILVDDLNQVDKKIEPSKLIIAEVNLEETVMLMQGKFSQTKNAKISFQSEQNLNPIFVIENEFNRVIENILENALDAISENGVVHITSINKNGKCNITIDDNGAGIPNAIRDHLFSKGATHGKINGIGLGLYHAKKTIESFGGSIECIALPVGTRFQIELPLMQTGVSFCALPIQKNINVIDDDITIINTLRKSGYNIEQSAMTYEKGIDILKNLNSDGDICLIDYMLNDGKRGTELIANQVLRKNIYLCTNDFDDLDLIKKAKDIGLKIIPKPLVFLTK